MGVSHEPHEGDRGERRMMPEVSEGQQQACLLMPTVPAEGPAQSPMAWESRQKAQASAFRRSRSSWGCQEHGGVSGQRRGPGAAEQCSRDALGHGDRHRALHLCLNTIAKANKFSWSLLTGRFVKMKSLHQVMCSSFEELKTMSKIRLD